MKVRLDCVCDILKGKTAITKAISGEYPLVVTAEERLTSNSYDFNCRAVCVPLVSATGHGHASIKRVHYQEGKFALGTILAAVIPKDNQQLDAKYLHIYLSYFKDLIIVPLMRGSANVSLTIKSLGTAEIELPPIERQREIIELITNLENEKKVMDYTISDQAKTFRLLKQNILQLAVQGKLVPQDSSDEPASVLLEKIKEEKDRLIREGEIKRVASSGEVMEDEKPFDLPRGWEWIRLGDVGYNLGQKKPDKTFTYIDVGSINKEFGVLGNEENIVEPEDAPSRARKLVDLGTIIYSTVRPYLLNIAIVDRRFDFEPIVSTAFAVIHPYSVIRNRFIFYYLRSLTFVKYVESQMVGMAYPAINDEKFFNGVFPLPPLEEQKRIVQKIDSLMSLCDELEKRIEKSRKYSENLLESVLKEAFKA